MTALIFRLVMFARLVCCVLKYILSAYLCVAQIRAKLERGVPRLKCLEQEVDFGVVIIGRTASMNFTLANRGTAAVRICS
jgi:hypothetical protein